MKTNKIDLLVQNYKDQLKSFHKEVRSQLEIAKYKAGLSRIDYPALRQSINDYCSQLETEINCNYSLNDNAQWYICEKLQDYSCTLHS